MRVAVDRGPRASALRGLATGWIRPFGVARHFVIGFGEPLEHCAKIRPDGFLRTQTRLHSTLAINSRVFFHHTTTPPTSRTFPCVICGVNVTDRILHSSRACCCAVSTTSDLLDLLGQTGGTRYLCPFSYPPQARRDGAPPPVHPDVGDLGGHLDRHQGGARRRAAAVLRGGALHSGVRRAGGRGRQVA